MKITTTRISYFAITAIFSLLLTSGVAFAASPRTNTTKEKTKTSSTITPQGISLVIDISVQDLQPEYIDLLRDKMTEHGFNMFYNKGVVIDNVDFGTPLDFTSALTLIATGASPAINGIPSTNVYNRETKRADHVFLDTSVMGNFTDNTYSPSAIATSTIADEVRIAGDGVTYVHSIAPDAATAIVQSAHAGNSAAWLNTETGNWASSTWYSELPTTITSRNRLMPLSSRIDTMAWTPLHPAEYYPTLPDHATRYPFRHVMPRGSREKFMQFANTPLINREITDIAIDYIKSLQLGRHDGVDMLNVAYTLRPFEFSKKSDTRFELMDSYYRLDKDISRLVNTAMQQVGADHVLVLLTATPRSTTCAPDDVRWKMPSGQFSTKKAISLLNMYLMARHGNGQWVQTFYGNDFYLNHQLIADKGKNIQEMRREAADFLTKMAGVYNVHTLDDIISGQAGEHAQALRRNTSPRHSGDLHISILPGWQLIDDAQGYVDPAKAGVYRAVSPTAPVMLWSATITPQRIANPVDARSIAPTISRLLRLRSPNAAVAPPINL